MAALSLRRQVKLAAICLSFLTITGLYLLWTSRYLPTRSTTTTTRTRPNKHSVNDLYIESNLERRYELPWHPLTNRPKDHFNILLSRTLNTKNPKKLITKYMNDRRNEKIEIQYSVGLSPPTSWENGGKASNQNEERCDDILCTQYLSGRDRRLFNICRVRTKRKISVIRAKEELDVRIAIIRCHHRPQ